MTTPLTKIRSIFGASVFGAANLKSSSSGLSSFDGRTVTSADATAAEDSSELQLVPQGTSNSESNNEQESRLSNDLDAAEHDRLRQGIFWAFVAVVTIAFIEVIRINFVLPETSDSGASTVNSAGQLGPSFVIPGEFLNSILSLAALSFGYLATFVFSLDIFRNAVAEISKNSPGMQVARSLSLLLLSVGMASLFFIQGLAPFEILGLAVVLLVIRFQLMLEFLRKKEFEEANNIVSAKQVCNIVPASGPAAVRTIAAENVAIGEIVSISLEQIIPFDVVVERGVACIREPLSGQVLIKQTGDPLHQGSFVLWVSDPFLAKVESTFGDGSLVQKIGVQKVGQSPHSLGIGSDSDDSLNSLSLLPFLALCSTAVVLVSLTLNSMREFSNFSIAELLMALAAVFLISSFNDAISLPLNLMRLGKATLLRLGILLREVEPAELAKIKSIFADPHYATNSRDGGEDLGKEIVSFQLFDQRFHEAKLRRVLGSILSRVPDQFSGWIERLVNGEYGEFFEVSDCQFYPGLGISAELNGEWSIGTEEFLIQRGVQLEPALINAAEGDEADCEWFFVAFQDSIVARFGLGEIASSKIIKQIEDQGLTLKDPAVIERKPQMALPAACYYSQDFQKSQQEESGILWVRNFDQLRWNIADKGIVLFRTGLPSLLRAINFSKTAVQISRLSGFLSLAVGVTLLTCALLGSLSPTVSALSVLSLSLLQFLLMQPLRREGGFDT